MTAYHLGNHNNNNRSPLYIAMKNTNTQSCSPIWEQPRGEGIQTYSVKQSLKDKMFAYKFREKDQ